VLTVGYFVYFLLIADSDYFRMFQYAHEGIAVLPNVYTLLQDAGIDSQRVSDIAFTFLQMILLANVVWLYRRGVENGKKSKLYNMPYLVGVAGDSGSGKSTFAQLLAQIFGKKNVAIIAGDDMHKWERGHGMWQKYTHLHPGANKLHDDLEHARTLKSGGSVYRRHYDHRTGTFTFPSKLESKKIVVFEGLHSFYLARMRRTLDLKVFIMPEEQLRIHWKLCRDMKDRGHTKEKVLHDLKAREKDAETFIKTQEEHADITVSLRSKEDLSEKFGEDISLDIFLELKCNNNVDMDLFTQELSSFVEIDHFFNEKSQMIRISGKIQTNEVEKISYRLIPELYDIVVLQPSWSGGYNGIIELFVCYYIINSLKFNTDEK
jgi:uridine kinase